MVMDRFAWIEAGSVTAAANAATATVAAAMAGENKGNPISDAAVVKAGGIDLLDLMKEGLLTPARLVNLRALPGLDRIEEEEKGGLRIGTLATLEQIEAHPLIRARHRAVAEAAGSSASPQLRHVATLGGNLLQRPRCWYFRSVHHRCARKGGQVCFAFEGENQYHAIFGHRHCAIVHPSTIATALVAFDAELELADVKGAMRRVPLEKFLIGPETDVTRENDLRPGEILTQLRLPPPRGARSAHLKVSEKVAFDWPIADVAVVLELDENKRCRRAALVLGAAAPVPYRARAAEEALLGRVADDKAAAAAAEAAMAEASPLAHNAYKVPIFKALIRRAVLDAAAS
jgi:xanthine dehydrogenase YagS FAD-binding subunit